MLVGISVSSAKGAVFPNGDNDDDRLGLDRGALPSQGYEDCIHEGL